MEITTGFILLFLVFVLPGFVFRRMYFLGEFSKQVSSSENIVKSLIYAIIPSTLIQILCLVFYNRFFDAVELSAVFDFYKKLNNPNFSFRPENPIDDKVFGYFGLYSIVVYFLSGLFGLFLHLVIRQLRLDIKFKILRFKNQWAYIFSGDALAFPKFVRTPKEESQNENRKYLFPYVDVLVRKSDNETILYSGYVKDYELKSKSVNELETIYLAEASRYKNGNELKKIPGNFLILFGKDLININVRYVYSSFREEKIKTRIDSWLALFNLFLLFVVIGSFPFHFIKLGFIEAVWYQAFFQLTWLQRIGVVFLTNSLYSVLFPFQKERPDNNYTWIGPRSYLATIIIVEVYLLIFTFWILDDFLFYKNHFSF